jgi:Polyketide cyclase / dehydrase and lipid transport
MPILQPVDESFFTTAPTRVSQTWSIPRPAAEVWAELTGEQPLHWCRGLNIKWTSERPFSVGTTRQAKVLGLLTVKEHFFIWEEGHRYAFHVTEANLPLFRSIAEDYLVEPDGGDRCRFTWSAAVAPSALGKPGAPANKLLFSSFFKDTARYFGAKP